MELRFITIILIILINNACMKMTTKDRYISEEEFFSNFKQEIVLSQEVYERMKKNGLQDYQFCKFDFDFISNSKDKLDSLKQFLTVNYNYEMEDIFLEDSIWYLNGNALKFPVDSVNIVCWVIDLYVKGYKFDCKLNGYGAIVDKPEFPDLEKEKADFYFEEALNAYNKQNLGLAIINWSTVLKINPNDPNAYYSRAIAKDEIHLSKSALKDYDKAIEIAPDFIDALLNRGSFKDEHEDYNGAIEDYNKILSLKNLDLDNKQKTYFNRGNTKLNMNNKNGACEDWKKAFELGADYAKEMINKHCK